MGTFNFVSLIVLAVVLVVAIVLCIVKREKVVEGLRAYKSEMKKITWFPWKAVWRSTILVLVVVIVTALLVGLLDIAFFEMQYLLTGQGFSFFGGQ
ncbi:MAG: preprotein translocase subunit SecE [Clostridia bacterium]|nr:preprotein translocase subunit SecE [Clostridia bacterium]